MKLREKILIPISIILAVGMIFISILLFVQSKEEINNEIINEMGLLTDMLIRDLDEYHASSVNDVEIFSENPLYSDLFTSDDPMTLDKANQELKMIKEKRREYESVGVTDRNGMIIACDNESLVGKISVENRDYFKKAVTGRSGFGDVVISKVTQKPVFGASSPIVINGEIQGVFFAVIDLTVFNTNYIDPIVVGSKGYAYMCNSAGTVLAYPDKEKILNLDLKKYNFGKEMISLKNGEIEYVFNGIKKTGFVRTSDDSGWIVCVTADDKDIFKGISHLLTVSIIITFLILALGITIIVFLTRSIVKPIKLNSVYADNLAMGDLTFKFDQKMLSSEDESGDLAKSFFSLIEKLSAVVTEVQLASHHVAQGSQQLSNTAEQISQGASEQAATSEEVSSSMEEIGSSIKQNADNASKTQKIASKAASDAEIGGMAVVETVEAMNSIAEKIKVIEEIARSTNMLSLNAAIEAARAGEHGKGFAVVASEVGKLAANSQKAAKEILELAQTSVQKANNAGEKIQAIVPDIKLTAELVQEILDSSLEQNAGAEQINQVILQLDQVIQTNASAAEESASMSEELSSQAEKLIEMIDFFKVNHQGPKNELSKVSPQIRSPRLGFLPDKKNEPIKPVIEEYENTDSNFVEF